MTLEQGANTSAGTAAQEEHMQFCQEPSKSHLKLIEECDGDPRLAEAIGSLLMSPDGGWVSPPDSRVPNGYRPSKPTEK